ARARLRAHAAPLGGVERQEEDGPAAGLRDVEEMLLIRLGGPPRARRQDLYDASVELAQRPAERDALLVGRESRRHGLPLRPGVRRRIGGAHAPPSLLDPGA